MKKRYLIVALLSMVLFLCNVSAMEFGDCEVLVSFKRSSSLDDINYICKGKEYGKSYESIYYNGSELKINGFDSYYFSVYENIKVNITGVNSISLMHLNNTKLSITGNGSLKFKEGSFVKKVLAGEAVYQYVYNGKTVIDSNDKIYEGTVEEFEKKYSALIEKNKLPEVFNIIEYELVQAIDYTNMSSVVITESWLNKHIETELESIVVDGYGTVKYVEKKKEEVKTEEVKKEDLDNTLETENVIFISKDKVDKKYELNVEDLKKEEVAKDVDKQLKDTSLISFYDVNVVKNKKPVKMKNGEYTIKIKIDKDSINDYEDYQIIYVNDEGEIEEYLEGVIEGDYIVFKTTHLSQYGVIAKEKVVEPVMVEVSDNKQVDVSYILKISILVVVIIIYLVIVSILLVKSKLVKFKKFKRLRKRTN